MPAEGHVGHRWVGRRRDASSDTLGTAAWIQTPVTLFCNVAKTRLEDVRATLGTCTEDCGFAEVPAMTARPLLLNAARPTTLREVPVFSQAVIRECDVFTGTSGPGSGYAFNFSLVMPDQTVVGPDSSGYKGEVQANNAAIGSGQCVKGAGGLRVAQRAKTNLRAILRVVHVRLCDPGLARAVIAIRSPLFLAARSSSLCFWPRGLGGVQATAIASAACPL